MSSIVATRTRMIFAFLVIVSASLLFTGWSTSALAKDIIVPVDEALLVRLDRPATEVIIGNPSIADVAVQNGQLLVVTGKSFGMTNMIVLDGKGRQILEEKVYVQTDPTRQVRVHKGKGRSSYNCTPRCETALIPGDAEGHFEALSKEIRSKFGIAQSALDGEGQGVQ